MSKSIPEHRHGSSERSGDTRVIGKDGKESNPDAEAREKAVKKPAAKAKPATGDKDKG